MSAQIHQFQRRDTGPHTVYVPPAERRPLLSTGQAVTLAMGMTIGCGLLYALVCAMLLP